MSRDRLHPRASHALSTFVGATCACLLQVLVVSAALAQPPSVLQRGYDTNVTNANLSETTLTATNISASTFGLVFSLPVDDDVYAQPLYVPGLTVNGATHNVLFVATMSDTVFAFDADTGTQLWSTSLLTAPGAVPVPIQNYAYSGNRNIVGNLGILSTPVIDPVTNTLYAVAATQENSTIVYRLHALNILNGALASNSGVPITGSFGGLTFNGRQQWQRLSMVLVGNNVIFGFGALELEYAGGYVGWVMEYNKSSLAQTGIFATVTNGSNNGGGVWQSGRPPVVDSSGYVYVFSGNSYGSNGYDGVHNFSESVLKLNPASGLALTDWFTPSNWLSMDNGDLDLTSSGPTMIPGTTLLFGGGKTGIMYLLNTTSLGHETSTNSGALQQLTISSGDEIRAGPTWWQRTAAAGGSLMYEWSAGDSLKAYSFNGSTFATTPVSQGTVTGQDWPGGYLTLSANGQTAGTGVIWASTVISGDDGDSPPAPGALAAYDASNLTSQLWSSTTNAARDTVGNVGKFVPPMVVNGRVYMATWSDKVQVYGLLGQTAPAPTFSPAPGSYSPGQQLTLSDSVSGAAIYYTLDGTTPTTSSTQYSGPITLNSTATVNAIAAATGYASSTVAGGTYTITGATTVVSLDSAGNVYGIVSNGSAVPNGGFDGDGDAYSATLLGSSVSWNGNTYSLLGAGIANAVSDTTVTLPAGSYATVSLLGAAVNGNQPNQTFVVNYTDGTSSTFTQSVSDWYTPQGYGGETQVQQMAYRVTANGSLDNRTFSLYGYSFAINPAKTVASITLPANRDVVIVAIDLSGSGSAPPPAATPTFSPAPGTYGPGQQVTLGDTTSGAAIHYTLDGTQPSAGSPLYTTAITLSSSTTINAIAVATGFSNSSVASGTYTIASGSGGTTSVDFAPSANVDGIANNGTAVPNGGLDGGGYAYSETLLGTSISWNGNSYSLLGADIADAVSNTTVTLPAGSYTSISLLGTGVEGNQANQSFVVHYTDGTTSTFTQSLSDWFTPQGYSGESKVLQMAYRVAPSGTQDTSGPFNLYGYSFALNSAKTVASITLPANRDVVIVAIDLTSQGTPPPTAATPTFSPTPGTYSPGQQVSLGDTTTGAAIHYTLDGTMPTASSPVYTAAITLNSSTTINAIAVASGFANSSVASGAYEITAGSGSATVVDFSSVANIDAIGATGTAVPSGGLDGGGYAYSQTLLGTSLTWNGNAYSFLGADTPDAVSNQLIALPAGNYSTLSLLATAVNGNQVNQTFIVTYTDGTSSTFTQSMSDWFTPQNYSGESKVLAMAYRVAPSGAQDSSGPFNLYGYTFTLNAAKTVASITLPANRDVVILAIDITAAGTPPPPAATPTFSPAPGTYTAGQQVSLGDTTSGAAIHYTLDGSMPTASSPLYASPITLNSTATINAIAVATGFSDSAVATGTYTISGSGSSTAVSLDAVANVNAIASNGSTVQNGGIDTDGYAYSATLLGTSLTWNGNTYSLLGPNIADAASNVLIALPSGSYSTISLLGTGVNGNQASQSFIVTYTDGTSTTFTQSMSDWFTPQSYTGESKAVTMTYRVEPSGALDERTFYLYGYTFTLNPAKTVASITLPANRHVVILAVQMN